MGSWAAVSGADQQEAAAQLRRTEQLQQEAGSEVSGMFNVMDQVAAEQEAAEFAQCLAPQSPKCTPPESIGEVKIEETEEDDTKWGYVIIPVGMVVLIVVVTVLTANAKWAVSDNTHIEWVHITSQVGMVVLVNAIAKWVVADNYDEYANVRFCRGFSGMRMHMLFSNMVKSILFCVKGTSPWRRRCSGWWVMW